MKNTNRKAVIRKLLKQADERPDIRAVLLTSSRARPGEMLDDFSDYDIILTVNDIRPYLDNEDWLEDYGEVLVVYRDPVKPIFGFDKFIRVTQYASGLKIDFTIWPAALLKHIAALPELPDFIDDGYRVLTDKDGLTLGMKAPSYQAFVPKPPMEKEYQHFIEGFFSNAPYAAKYIRRGDFFPLKGMLNYMRYEKFAKLLEWQVQIEHNWSLKSGLYGKGLQKYISPETLKEIESTEQEENWGALLEIIKMFSKAAREAGQKLGYSYPEDMETGVIAYVKKVKTGELP